MNFCHDALWEANKTWNTNNPQLTDCFQTTVLGTDCPLSLGTSHSEIIYGEFGVLEWAYWTFDSINIHKQFLKIL